MMLFGILAMIVLVTLVPAAVGTLFSSAKKEGAKVLFYWVCGQMVLWTGFQVMSVPMIYRGLRFPQVRAGYYLIVGGCLFAAGVAALLRRVLRKKGMQGEASGRKKSFLKKEAPGTLLYILFAVMVLIQLVLAVVLAYEEGDDAFYVAITTFSKEMDGLYTNNPYTGAYVGLDARHWLAPFPVWVAVLADLSGLSGAATAHVVMPLLIIPMTYAVFYLLGEALLSGKGEKEHKGVKLAAFMCFTALLVFFGGYSVYSTENFLLVRAGQGKAVLANVLLPFLIYVLLRIFQKYDSAQKNEGLKDSDDAAKQASPAGGSQTLHILLVFVMTAGCLCSTQGGFLMCMLLGAAAFCGACVYKRFGVLVTAVLAMILPGIFSVLYALS